MSHPASARQVIPFQASRNPFAVAHSHLIRRLLEMKVPKGISLRTPRRGEFEEIADFIRELANVCDECLYAVGAEVADNAARAIDMRLFTGAFLGAVEGNAAYEAATALSSEFDEER